MKTLNTTIQINGKDHEIQFEHWPHDFATGHPEHLDITSVIDENGDDVLYDLTEEEFERVLHFMGNQL